MVLILSLETGFEMVRRKMNGYILNILHKPKLLEELAARAIPKNP